MRSDTIPRRAVAARPTRAIHIATRIDATLERVWELTQDPRRHERWDVRFGSITPGDPGEFSYRTFGVGGIGRHTKERHRADGSATSGLRFTCSDWRSPIVEGSGYWRYRPAADGVLFETGYDFRARYALIDPVFRPIMAWGTAWSFDRLRLWAEHDIDPRRSLAIAWLDLATRLLVVGATLAVGGWTGIVASLAVLVAMWWLPPLPWRPSARRVTWSIGHRPRPGIGR